MNHAPTHRAGVCTAVLDGEAVLYVIDEVRPVLLNTSATAVWLALDGERDIDQITHELAESYGIDEDQMAHDVAAVLRELAACGLLEEARV